MAPVMKEAARTVRLPAPHEIARTTTTSRARVAHISNQAVQRLAATGGGYGLTGPPTGQPNLLSPRPSRHRRKSCVDRLTPVLRPYPGSGAGGSSTQEAVSSVEPSG